MREKPFSKFQILANVVMMLWTVIVIAPFILLFMSSITDENILISNGYAFWPEKFSIAAYAYIIKSKDVILRAYGISILITVVGTVINVLLSAMMGYALSVRRLPGRYALSFFVFFTTLFSGGIVPSYLMWTGMFHIKDTIFAQLIPNLLMSGWNVLLIRSYFTNNIPESISEAAEIDGATPLQIFVKITLPLGKPILVTMGTFAGISYWNDWTNGLYYILKNTKLYNVQNLLNQMVSNIQYLTQNASNSNMASAVVNIPATSTQMAIAVTGIIPLILIFPFFQKYYAKGITLGGVKG